MAAIRVHALNSWLSGQVGDLEPELLVDGCLHGGISGADDVTQVAEADDEGADVVFGEPAAGLAADLAGVAGERCGPFGLDLAAPLGDGLRVRGLAGDRRSSPDRSGRRLFRRHAINPDPTRSFT